MVREPADKRAINRVPCKLAVSNAEQSSSIGDIEDLSLDGAFIASGRPLPVGSVVPLIFELGTHGEIRPFAEIVRETPRGCGARFVRLSEQDTRRLRRYMAEINSLDSHRKAADRAKAMDDDALFVDNPKRITDIFTAAVATPSARTFTIIPRRADVRVEAQIQKVDGNCLHFSAMAKLTVFKKDDPVLVLHTHQFSSYSFETHVMEAGEDHLRLIPPTRLYYSERRGGARLTPTGNAEIVIALPWQNGEKVGFPICERSPTGLSFRVSSSDIYFWPGTPLPNADIKEGDDRVPVENLVVKHLTSMSEPDGGTWLKVGVAMGHQRGAHSFQDVSQDEKKRLSKYKKARRLIRGALDRLTYLYHKRAGNLTSHAKPPPFSVVRFKNERGLPVTCLLNLTFRVKDRTRGPLIIVSPGFAGRKETFSPLAMTMIHNFRRHNLDAAVLRLDGTNNLGESFKDPGCEADGKHCINYTLSGCMSDIVGAVRWARNNIYIDPTAIILISSSFSSISARKALTIPEMREVTQWIALMGPPDGAHPVANAMGTSDPYNNFLQGIKNGVVTLFGCLADADNVCRDMHEHHLATLEDARLDMAKIKADVTWVIGKHDGFIDPKRVEDVMSVKAPGKRQVLAVDAGHLPRTSEEALKQFCLITTTIQDHLKLNVAPPAAPSGGWLAAIGELEWQRVRKSRAVSDKNYWKNYLVGDGTIGYDIWSVTEEYRQLMTDQVRLLDAAGCSVLDLGAGTGNASAAVAAGPKPASITAFELVAEALDRTKGKVAPTGVPLQTVAGSAEGNLRTAVRRWLSGDLPSIQDLLARLPGRYQETLSVLPSHYTRALHAILRGGEGDVGRALQASGLPENLRPYIEDLCTLVRLEHGKIDLPAAKTALSEDLRDDDILAAGLPFASDTFDRIICSLVLSYLRYPEDALAEAHRVLKPGGVLLVSTMKPDSEGSQTYLNAIKLIQEAPLEALPPGYTRQNLLDATHRFLDHASDLVRLEEEGLFKFWDGPQLASIVQEAGFREASATESFGSPAQVVIVRCRK